MDFNSILQSGNPDAYRVEDEKLIILGKHRKINKIYVQNSNSIFNGIGWVINDDLENCMVCAKKFGYFGIKQHCRGCGNIVCQHCSPYKSLIFGQEACGEQRVCNQCYWGQDIIYPTYIGGLRIDRHSISKQSGADLTSLAALSPLSAKDSSLDFTTSPDVMTSTTATGEDNNYKTTLGLKGLAEHQVNDSPSTVSPGGVKIEVIEQNRNTISYQPSSPSSDAPASPRSETSASAGSSSRRASEGRVIPAPSSPRVPEYAFALDGTLDLHSEHRTKAIQELEADRARKLAASKQIRSNEHAIQSLRRELKKRGPDMNNSLDAMTEQIDSIRKRREQVEKDLAEKRHIREMAMKAEQNKILQDLEQLEKESSELRLTIDQRKKMDEIKMKELAELESLRLEGDRLREEEEKRTKDEAKRLARILAITDVEASRSKQVPRHPTAPPRSVLARANSNASASSNVTQLSTTSKPQTSKDVKAPVRPTDVARTRREPSKMDLLRKSRVADYAAAEHAKVQLEATRREAEEKQRLVRLEEQKRQARIKAIASADAKPPQVSISSTGPSNPISNAPSALAASRMRPAMLLREDSLMSILEDEGEEDVEGDNDDGENVNGTNIESNQGKLSIGAIPESIVIRPSPGCVFKTRVEKTHAATASAALASTPSSPTDSRNKIFVNLCHHSIIRATLVNSSSSSQNEDFCTVIGSVRPTVDKSGEESTVCDVVINSTLFAYLFESIINGTSGTPSNSTVASTSSAVQKHVDKLMSQVFQELGDLLNCSLSIAYVILRVKGNYKGDEKGPSDILVPPNLVSNDPPILPLQTTPGPSAPSTLILIPTCIQGIALNIHPTAANTDKPVGEVKSGEVVEVLRQVQAGFYQLADGRGFVFKNTIGVTWASAPASHANANANTNAAAIHVTAPASD